jgi:hypothetical protein
VVCPRAKDEVYFYWRIRNQGEEVWEKREDVGLGGPYIESGSEEVSETNGSICSFTTTTTTAIADTCSDGCPLQLQADGRTAHAEVRSIACVSPILESWSAPYQTTVPSTPGCIPRHHE